MSINIRDMAPMNCIAALTCLALTGCEPASQPNVDTSAADQQYDEQAFDDGYVFIKIPAGSFSMGTEEGEAKELPIHEVELDDYWIGKYPVTVAQFATFVDDTGYVTDAENGEGCWIESGGSIRYDINWRRPDFDQRSDHPVICVSWNDAMAYADWFSVTNGVRATLPTEAQWEKAARGDDQRIWPWGNTPPDGSQANFADAGYASRFGTEFRTVSPDIDDGYPQTSPVDAFPDGRSPYGVYDMAGNTIDWLYDWFDDAYYADSPAKNPLGPQRTPVRIKTEFDGGWGDNLQRAIRGGAWTDASGVLSLEEGGHSIRSDMRERTDMYSSDDHLGIRLVIDEQQRHPPYQPVDPQAPLTTTAAASVMEHVGDAAILVEYDRLLVGEQEGKTFGYTIPHDEAWSPGDLGRTRITVSEDVTIHDQTLPAGSYTLFMVPEKIPDGGDTWTIVFTRPEARAFMEVLRLRTRAQLEDNSKLQMEYFFDDRDGTRILRFLHDFVEVHIPFEHPNRNADEVSQASAMNAMGDAEVNITYSRDLIAEGSPGFGKEIPFDQAWDGGNATIEFSEDVLVDGNAVSAGAYSLSVVPKQDTAWTVTLNPKSETDAAVNLEMPVELDESGPTRLEYFYEYIGEHERQLLMAWGGGGIALTITTPEPNQRQ